MGLAAGQAGRRSHAQPARWTPQGQSTVPASEAQVIFSTTPLWSVAFAWVLLGGEPISERTWIGGTAVLLAGLLASVPTPLREKQE